MFDIGWSELLVVAVVALIVIGPKELPRVLYNVGKWVGRARSMVHDFQNNIEEMGRQSELDEVRRKFNESGADLKQQINAEIDLDREIDVGRSRTARNTADADEDTIAHETPVALTDPADGQDDAPPETAPRPAAEQSGAKAEDRREV